MRFGKRKPACWELALLPGQKLAELSGDEVFGYPVDAGTGAFFDARAAEALFEEDVNQALLERSYDEDAFSLDLPGELNVVAFHSGQGDGVYDGLRRAVLRQDEAAGRVRSNPAVHSVAPPRGQFDAQESEVGARLQSALQSVARRGRCRDAQRPGVRRRGEADRAAQQGGPGPALAVAGGGNQKRQLGV